MAHLGYLKSYKQMIRLIIQNKDDDNSGLTLQEIIYEPTMECDKVREVTLEFLENLDLVIECVEKDHFPEIYFLWLLPVNQTTIKLLKTYFSALLTPLAYTFL